MTNELKAPDDLAGELAMLTEKAVMVCPQCEGEGSYADGLDEAACSMDCTRCGSNGWIVDLAALTTNDALIAEKERLKAALTPDGDTKADYMGEFAFRLFRTDENGDDYAEQIYVPWTTIKEIMAAILARAALTAGGSHAD